MKDFIEVIAEHIRSYREMYHKAGSKRVDRKMAHVYFSKKLDNPDLTLQLFLDKYYKRYV